MSNLYVYTQGSNITFKDNRLQIAAKDECTTSIPVESVDNVLLFGGVNISTPCIHELLKRGVHTTWLSKTGGYYGRIESTDHVNIHRQRLQFRKSDDPKFCLAIAKRFVLGKATNQRTVLSRYNRKNDSLDLNRGIDEIWAMIKKIESSKSIEQLMGFEGTISKLYFKGLNCIVCDDFKFEGRSKRPPRDAFNSVLSFGYTVLLYEIFTSVLSKGLNPYAAFLHRDKHNHPALCSDLIEEWRPILVDSLALSLLNNHDLTHEHFERHANDVGIYLNRDGIQIFVTNFEKRMKQEVKYLTEIDYRMSFRRIIEYQVGLLIKSLENDNPLDYVPVFIR